MADSDGDGLPDSYESAYGGVGGLLDPLGDADGDTMNNLAEYLAGTNPTNAASYLKMESITAAGGAILQFGAVANHTYTIQYSPGPGGGTWANLAHFASRPADHVESLFDSADATNRFYRVATPKAP